MFQRWDSLYYQMMPDSVRYGVVDRATLDESPHSLSQEQIFGEAFEDATLSREVLPYVDMLVDNPLYQTIVLALIASYMLLVCANLRSVVALFSREGVSKSSVGRSFTAALIMGLVSITLVGVRVAESLPASELGCGTLMLLLTCGWMFVVAAQLGLIWIIGRVTLTSDLSSDLVGRKSQYFSLASILAIPFSLLYVLSPPGVGGWWIWVVVAIVSVAVLLFLKDSLLLFISKKISILHWFLYLCCVEIWPISFVWALANR